MVDDGGGRGECTTPRKNRGKENVQEGGVSGLRTPSLLAHARTPVSYTIATDDFLVHLVQINAVAEAI